MVIRSSLDRWRWLWKVPFIICFLVPFPSVHCRLVCRSRLHQPRIYEGAPAGQYVMTVRAHDEFGASHILYQLAQGKDTFFVEEDTGRLNTARRIEKKVGDTYHVSIVAVSGGQTELCPLEVRVTRLNQHAPVFRFPFYRAEVSASTPVRTQLLTISASDADVEDYNAEIYYFLTQITKEDRGQFSTSTFTSVSTGWAQEPEEWVSAELDREELMGNLSSGVMWKSERWLTVERRSGAVVLNRALNKNVGLIRAKVLAVDGGSPPRWTAASLELVIKNINPPLNLSANNVTESNVRVCWLGPLQGAPSKGFLVRFRPSNVGNTSSPMQDRTLNVTVGVTQTPSCVYLASLQPATNYELKVYGWNDEEVGMGSEMLLFTTRTPRCTSDVHCGNGSCYSINGSFSCKCQEGFSGENCQYFDPCASQPCLNLGTCVNKSGDYVCLCSDGFSGLNCSYFNPCANPRVRRCFNSGTCVSNANHTHHCLCPPGYFGSKCERSDPCQLSFNRTCFNGGICQNVSNHQFLCICPPGFTGVYCEVDIDDCAFSTCLHGGSCVDGVHSFTCNCPAGYTGALCHVEVDPCESNPCNNEAVCEKRDSSFVCLCPTGFTGKVCDEKILLCDSLPCVNGGSCEDTDGHFQCLCPPQFQGDTCQFSAECDEEILHFDGGTLHFHRTLADEVAIIPCPFGPAGASAERLCENTYPSSSKASWGNLNTTQCRLQEAMEAENVTKRLLALTKDGSHLNSRQIHEVTEQIELVLDYALQDNNIANYMFEVMSNLLDANDTAFSDDNSGNASSRLNHLIDKYTRTVKVADEMHINTDNLLIHVVKKKANRKDDAVILQGLAPVSVDSHNDSTPIPTMTISSDVMNKAGEGTKDVRLHFVAHRNAKLFREKNSDGKSLDRATLSARPVFSVSVANFNVSNIPNGVNFTVRKPLYGQWMCTYWSEDENRWVTNGMTAIQDDQFISCSANHMTSFSILLDPDPDEGFDPQQEKALSIISYVGSGLSVLGLILTIITFSMFRCLNRDRSGKILLNLCVSMLLLNVSFLSGAFKADELKKSGQVIESDSNSSNQSTDAVEPVQRNSLCTAVAVFTHYFLLTTLSWMTVEAINMYQLLIYVFATSESRFLLKRSFVAWGAPAVIVGVTAAVDIQYYNPNNQYCMLSASNSYVYYLTLLCPCCVLLLVNTVVFVMVSKVLFQPRKGGGRVGQKNSKWRARDLVTFAQVRGAFTVMTLLGVTWVFGALAIGPARGVFQYIFCVCNSLQGFLVFVVRCLQYPEARSAWMLFFRTGTLKKHRGTKLTTATNSSNNSHVKLTLSNAVSSNSGSTTTQRLRERSLSTTTSTVASSLKRPPAEEEGRSSSPASSWVYGGEKSPNTKVESDDTKEGHFTKWEYITWQQKRDEDMAQEEQQGFKSVWMVPEASPLKFIEDDESVNISGEKIRVGTLTDQGYASAEHSPSSKRDGGGESNC